jgi:hypothetical protein
MPNIKQTIEGHNKTKLTQRAKKVHVTVERKRSAQCPKSVNLVESIVYQATVSR